MQNFQHSNPNSPAFSVYRFIIPTQLVNTIEFSDFPDPSGRDWDLLLSIEYIALLENFKIKICAIISL